MADLEHRQWMHWSKYVAENHDIPNELRDKWEKSWKPYEELSEEEKEKDRKWARKAAEPILEYIDERIEQKKSELEDVPEVAQAARNSIEGRINELELLKSQLTDPGAKEKAGSKGDVSD